MVQGTDNLCPAQMWDHRKNFVNVALQVPQAHQFGSEITGVMFGYDNRLVDSGTVGTLNENLK